ncbi:MAG: hexulose-6-phosphate isomerase [Proteobacteria bacterium]|nr:hexulose-6-phosphate isomerase [Pseudomonadota bacterium]
MNKRQRKTLERILVNPVLKNIKWADVKALILSLEGIIKQGNGSRIRIVLGGISVNIHTSHPGNELKPYQVRVIRKLLEGIEK